MASKQMTPLVVDLSHHNEIDDWAKVYAAGIRGVIHKATQGTGMVDTTYAARKEAALSAGLLWGAYHFADDSDVTKQVDNFLSAVKPDGRTLLCLDYEPNGSRTMSFAQAKQWLKLVFERTGQRPVLYSGNLIKEQMVAADDFVNAHRLWLAQYGPAPRLPKGWSNYWLWQYTGDGVGNGPHSVPGIKTNGIDLNVFGGNDLAAEWIDTPEPAVAQVPIAPPPAPVAPVSIADIRGQSRKLALIDLYQKTLKWFGIPATGMTFADFVNPDTPMHQLVMLMKENIWAVLGIGCVAGFLANYLLEHWILDDHNAGRYVPSKTEGA